VTEYPLPTGNPGDPTIRSPQEIALGSDGRMWFTEASIGPFGGWICAITPGGNVTEFAILPTAATPGGLRWVGMENVVHRGLWRQDW